MLLIRKQFLRYAMIGMASNAVLYFAYLAFTYSGLGHKVAMTVVYMLGVTQTFFFNRRWTFNHSGTVGRAMVRYWAAYGFGYVINNFALHVLSIFSACHMKSFRA